MMLCTKQHLGTRAGCRPREVSLLSPGDLIRLLWPGAAVHTPAVILQCAPGSWSRV
jgi:hypothetical protein